MSVGGWDTEADNTRRLLAERDPAGYIDALLADGEPDTAWAAAATGEHELLALDPETTGYVVDAPTTVSLPIEDVIRAVPA